MLQKSFVIEFDKTLSTDCVKKSINNAIIRNELLHYCPATLLVWEEALQQLHAHPSAQTSRFLGIQDEEMIRKLRRPFPFMSFVVLQALSASSFTFSAASFPFSET